MTMVFAKGKGFYLQVDWWGDRRQGSYLSPDPGLRRDFKGCQHQVFLDSGLFASGVHVPVVSWSFGSVGGAVKGSQMLLKSGVSKV